MSAGAISPLVTVLSNGKTDEGRQEAAKTLATLANSGSANQLAIAVGLVALLGVGTDQAQEYVTKLLLDLSSGLEEDLENRKAIANAGPFKMLVAQLGSQSTQVRVLAVAVMSKLAGDTPENIEQIAKANGVKPLVNMLSGNIVYDAETQANVATVLADMTRVDQTHAKAVAREGGIPNLVKLLATGHTLDAKAEAASALGSVAVAHPTEVAAAGAIPPLMELLKSKNMGAEKQASKAVAGIAAGGQANQDLIEAAGGIQHLVDLLDSGRGAYEKSSRPGVYVKEWDVQAHAARALGELVNCNHRLQVAAADCGGIERVIKMMMESERDEPTEQAGFALWRLAFKCHENQVRIAEAGGVAALVQTVGTASDLGQEMAAEALAGLASDNESNQKDIAEILIKLLRESSPTGVEREKAARAVSRFAFCDGDGDGEADAVEANQQALFDVGGVELVVSLIEPLHYEEPPLPTADQVRGKLARPLRIVRRRKRLSRRRSTRIRANTI